MFSKETYIQRRNTLKESVGHGLLLFLGNGETGRNYEDNAYHFRQDSTFLYYFGADYAGVAAIIDADSGEEVIFGDELTIDSIVWMGSCPSIREKSMSAGISRTLPLDKLQDYISSALKGKREIHYLPPYRAEHTLWLMELLGKTREEVACGSSFTLIKSVINQRNHKSLEEIEEIERAVDITVLMHRMAMRKVKPGILEAEVRAAVEEVAYRGDFTISFPTIATINGQTLHNHCYSHTLEEGGMFLLDAGAESHRHYAGDMTSTIPVGNTLNTQRRFTFDLVVDMFNTAVENIKENVPYREVHFKTARTMVEALKSVGLMKGDTDLAVSSGAYAMFFPHGLGHMMGLDVHDMENLGELHVGYSEGERKDTRFGLKSLRLARPLEEGFCFTVEPGVYFIPELMDKWHAEGLHTEFINYTELEKWKEVGGVRTEMDYAILNHRSHRLGHINKPLTFEEVLEAKNSNP